MTEYNTFNTFENQWLQAIMDVVYPTSNKGIRSILATVAPLSAGVQREMEDWT